MNSTHSKIQQVLVIKGPGVIVDIPNGCLKHHPRRPLVHLTHLINHRIRLSHFPSSCKEAKGLALPKPDKDPILPPNL
jgi:hypothetical protein